jgi:hypothetical protein
VAAATLQSCVVVRSQMDCVAELALLWVVERHTVTQCTGCEVRRQQGVVPRDHVEALGLPRSGSHSGIRIPFTRMWTIWTTWSGL